MTRSRDSLLLSKWTLGAQDNSDKMSFCWNRESSTAGPGIQIKLPDGFRELRKGVGAGPLEEPHTVENTVIVAQLIRPMNNGVQHVNDLYPRS